MAVRIQVISPDENSLLASRYGEWAHTSHNVADCFSRLEQSDHAPMLRIEPAVPVHLGVVKAENTAFLPHLNIHVMVASQNFVLKGTIFVLIAYSINFVDHSAYGWILIEENFCD